jgi:N-acetyl-alpha-D-muramate 1-phosphate uridylyltransferase
MSAVPASAMVLAAGLGTRLRPVTDALPKPLVEVGGRTLLDHAIDRLAVVGVAQVVVNVHYKADIVAAHLTGRSPPPRIDISREAVLLETGGGVRRALPLLGERFFVVNSDVLWRDRGDGALVRLAAAFDPERHDAILLLQPTVGAVGYEGRGDYFLAGDVPRRRGEGEIAPYLFSGIQLLHRRAFAGIAQERFSLNLVYDRAAAAGRLAAIVHGGEWYHVGTPDGLAATRAAVVSQPVKG